MEEAFMDDVKELFPDFEEVEEVVEEETAWTPFLDKMVAMIPEIQEASIEERVEAVKILLG